MPGLFTLRPRTTQPTIADALDNNHPLYSQVRVACAFNRDLYDYKRKKSYTGSWSGTNSWKGSDSDGSVMMEFSGAASAQFPIRTDPATATGFSNLVPSGSLLWVVIRFRINSLGTRRAIFADFSAAGSGLSCRFEQQAGDTYLFSVNNGATDFSVLGPFGVSIGVHTAAMWVGGDSKPRIAIDTDQINVGISPATAPRAAGSDFRLGSAGAFATLPFDGGINAFIVGEATATESFVTGGVAEGAILALRRNPWSLWEDEVDYGFFSPAAAAVPLMGQACL